MAGTRQVATFNKSAQVKERTVDGTNKSPIRRGGSRLFLNSPAELVSAGPCLLLLLHGSIPEWALRRRPPQSLICYAQDEQARRADVLWSFDLRRDGMRAKRNGMIPSKGSAPVWPPSLRLETGRAHQRVEMDDIGVSESMSNCQCQRREVAPCFYSSALVCLLARDC
jgi:hypothetical protein